MYEKIKMGCSTNDQRTMEENTNPKNAEWNTIFVLSSPGGGKGTQRDKIKNKYKIYHYSCGELLRNAVKENNEEAELINSYMKEGKIVPARITCELQKKCMEKMIRNIKIYYVMVFQ